ncbi:MAG: SDR family oxidoreductase [Acetivibrionales bacterium]|nr:SDR family oxidoreductase [Clostridiaceae bacterium]
MVTGGAGFIGSNLVETLLEKDSFVRVLDNLSTGKMENIKSFLGNKQFEFIEGDIRDVNMCQKACKDIDFVLHQAALGSVPRSIKDPVTTNDVNVGGTLNMLIAARDNKVKRFVFASSSSVYGDEKRLPKKEGRVGVPLSPYAVSKKTNELYARNFYDLYGLETIGLRYFNVFGRRQDPDSPYAAVIPIFIKNILNNRVSTINGDGEQTRDFTYIDNVVDANLKACFAKKAACGKVFNIANGDRISVNSLYKKICELLKRQTNMVYGPTRAGDVKDSNADIKRANRYLNYSPLLSFDKGLESAVEWYVNNSQM